MKKLLFSLALMAISFFVFAQNNVAAAEEAREAKGLRADGKIYVVVVVLVTILSGFFIYLIRLDRKITKLEKGALSK